MKKLENYILQRFLFELIEVLKEYNETTNTHTAKSLNIPFIISSLYQNFSKKKQINMMSLFRIYVCIQITISSFWIVKMIIMD